MIYQKLQRKSQAQKQFINRDRLPLLVLIGFILAVPNVLKAQSGGCYGYGTNNSEEAKDVLETDNGHVFVAGKTNQNSGDAYLMKFAHGNLSKDWDQTYGNGSKAESFEAMTLHNGDLVLAGYTKKHGDKDILLMRIDTANGNVINNRFLGNSDLDVAFDIIENQKGNLVATGRTKTTSGQNSILTFVLEFTLSASSFTIHNQFAYGTGNTNYGYALEQDSEGDYWVVGKETNNSGIGFIYQLEENFSNNTASDVIYKAGINDKSNSQVIHDIQEDGNKMVITGTGKFQGTGISAKTVYVAKLDHTTSNPANPDQPVTKMKEFGSGNTEKAKALSIHNQSYVMTGSNGNDKLFSLKVKNDLSSIQWALESGGGSTDFGNCLTKLQNGDYLSVGKSQSSSYTSGSGNFYLNEIDAGNNCCSQDKTSALSQNSLSASNLFQSPLSNSNFSIDQAKLANNIASLSNPQSSANNGSFEKSGGCGALPVEFNNFSLSKRNGNRVHIQWQTASETNNNYFTILRAHEDQDFKPVARKEGQGTTITPTDYAHRDEIKQAGQYYYKIRQTDYDGSTSTSSVKAVNIKNTHAVTIEQVQTRQGQLQLHLKGIQARDCAITVRSASGRQIGRKRLQAMRGSQTIRFQGTDLNNQLFYIRIINTLDGSTLKGRKVMGFR